MALDFLTPGQLVVPAAALRSGWPGLSLFRNLLIPTTVGVLTYPDGRVVLVDAGFSEQELEDPRRNLPGFHGWLTRIRGTGGDSVVAQLRGRGIGADQVVAIVATHLHLDHIGAFVDFPNAEVVAPATEFASGRTRGQLGGYVHLPGILRSGRARPILFERPGRHGFPGCFDLFGDGNVVLLDARGHTAGSAAVLLRDPESGRQTLMAGDAAYTGAEFRLARMSLLMSRVGFHRDWVRETWALLNEFERSHPSIPVVLSHDAEMYGGLCHDV